MEFKMRSPHKYTILLKCSPTTSHTVCMNEKEKEHISQSKTVLPMK